MVNKKSSNKKRKSINLGVVVVALILVIVAIGWWLFRPQAKDNSTSNEPTFQTTSTGKPVNLNPPTDEDKQQVDQTKDQLGDNPSLPPAESGKKDAKPFITYAAQQDQTVTVNGYVGGIFEDGGTCRAEFTLGSYKVSGQSSGFGDSNHTTCSPISAQRSSFPQAGSWSVILHYSSAAASGSSEAQHVTIQ